MSGGKVRSGLIKFVRGASRYLGKSIGIGIVLIQVVILAQHIYIYAFDVPRAPIAKPLVSLELCSDKPFFFSSIYSFMGLAFVVSFFLGVLLYLLSFIVENQRFKVYLRTDLMDILITFFVLTLSFILLQFMCAYTITAYGINFNIFEFGFFVVQLIERVVFMILGLMTTLTLIALFFLKVFVANTMFGGLKVPVFSGVSILFKSVISTSLTSGVLTYLLYVIQTFLYEFFTYGALKYLLPLGLFLRAFSPLKKIGGALIGFSLGTTLFLTVSYTLIFFTLTPFISPLNLELEEVDRAFEVKTFDFDLLAVSETIEYINQKLPELEKNLDEFTRALDSSNVVVEGNERDYVVQDPVNATRDSISPQIESSDLIFEPVSKSIKFGLYSLALFLLFLVIIPVFLIIFVSSGVRFFAAFFGLELDITNLTRVV